MYRLPEPQHLFFYAPGITYAYVFSLRSKMWGMCFSEFTGRSTNPATESSGAVLDLTNLKRKPTACLSCTRPMNSNRPTCSKHYAPSVRRGYFAPTHIKLHHLCRSQLHSLAPHRIFAQQPSRNIHGTPYKFFRIATLATLDPNEKSINGASMQFDCTTNQQTKVKKLTPPLLQARV